MRQEATAEAIGNGTLVPNTTGLAVKLLDGIGRPDFQQRLAQALKREVIVDAGLILLYRCGGPPKILFNDWRTHEGLSDIRHYLQGPYQQDPFYNLVLDNGDDGLYRLHQIAPAFDRSQYYRDYYRHSGLHDEFNLFVSLDTRTKVAISLARRRTHEAFNSADTQFLHAAAPLLSSAIRRHFLDLCPQALDGATPPLQKALTQALNHFGRSVLTERECEIAQLILHGYSVKGAATKLRIAPATVKLHRRNLYGKLDINCQTALFSLFIDAASSATNIDADPLAGYLDHGRAPGNKPSHN